MKKLFFWHKNVNFCVKKRKKSFFWHKNVFFWYKNGFFTKKMSFKTKMSQKWKKIDFWLNFWIFSLILGFDPKNGSKMTHGPPFWGVGQIWLSNSMGGRKRLSNSMGCTKSLFWGVEKTAIFDYQIQWFFFKKSENGGFPSDKMTKNGQKMAIFLKKSNREIQGFFFEKKVIGKSRGFFWYK